MRMGLALQSSYSERDYENVIVGLGDTGLSVANFMRTHKKPFVIVDSRSNPPQLNKFKELFPQAEVILGEFSEEIFKHAKQIILSPGIDIKDPIIRAAVSSGINCIGDIEIFAKNVKIPTISITGSNGKSTVTSLVVNMANEANVKAYAGGNLGPPALDLLRHKDAELFVLELSSFQLESTLSLKSAVSSVLNISPDHLDRHGSVDHYAQIKAKIYERTKCSVINRDDTYVSSMEVEGDVISFGLDQPIKKNFGLVAHSNEIFLAQGNKLLMPASRILMYGEAGILNSLAALAVGYSIQLPMEKMLEVLTTFKGLPHRLSCVRTLKGVSWFNDSKGTNVGATTSSIKSLDKNIILLAGGVHKGGDLDLLSKAVKKHVQSVILFGQDATTIKQALIGATNDIQIVGSMCDAVSIANDKSKSGDKVLLSPACASFDMYSNYIERGNNFEFYVRAL